MTETLEKVHNKTNIRIKPFRGRVKIPTGGDEALSFLVRDPHMCGGSGEIPEPTVTVWMGGKDKARFLKFF